MARAKNCSAAVADLFDFCGTVGCFVVAFVGNFRFFLRTRDTVVVLLFPVVGNYSLDRPRDPHSFAGACRCYFFQPSLVLDPALAHLKIWDRAVDYS